MQKLKSAGNVTYLELSTSSSDTVGELEKNLGMEFNPGTSLEYCSGAVLKVMPGKVNLKGIATTFDGAANKFYLKGTRNGDWSQVDMIKGPFSHEIETDGEIAIALATVPGGKNGKVEISEVMQLQSSVYPEWERLPLTAIQSKGAVKFDNGEVILSTGTGDVDDSGFKDWTNLQTPDLMTEGSGVLFNTVPGTYEVACYCITTERDPNKDALFVLTAEGEKILLKREAATTSETKTRFSSGLAIAEFETKSGEFALVAADTGSKTGTSAFHIGSLTRITPGLMEIAFLPTTPTEWQKDVLVTERGVIFDLKFQFSGIAVVSVEGEGNILINGEKVKNAVFLAESEIDFELVSDRSSYSKVIVDYVEVTGLKDKLKDGVDAVLNPYADLNSQDIAYKIALD